MAEKPDILKPDTDDQGQSLPIGARFRQARELCPLNRTDFCNKHGLNCYTVQSWELGRSFSRTTNITKFIEALTHEGIICSEAWLMEEVGPEPYLASSSKAGVFAPPITPRQLKKKTSNLSETLIQKEITLFSEHSLKMRMDEVIIQLSDDAMSPDYEAGEFIGAWRISNDQIDRLHYTVCLIETTPNHFLVRRLLKEGNAYILMALNKDIPLIRLNQVTSVAEIIWRRRTAIY
ncbi:MAG: hypothetical protein ACOH2E_07140 [Candidatus Paracaedibacter sp.]